MFRVCGRDDRQGTKVADYLADIGPARRIAILDDGTTFGAGLANAVQGRLHERGLSAAMAAAYTPGEAEYSALVSKMAAAGIEVVFVGGYHRETGLIFRQAHDQGYDLRLVANSAMATADFPMITGPEVEGTVMAAAADARKIPAAAEVVARFRAEGYDPPGFTLYAYAAVQVWAEAVGGRGRAGPGCGDRSHAQPPVRHGAGPDRLRRQGRRHGLRALAMVRLAGGRHLPAAGAKLGQEIG